MSVDSPSPIPRSGVTKLQQRLAECYKQGNHLMEFEKNHDYAHIMFAECVLHDPANLTYVEALLRNLRAKFPKPIKKLLGRGASRALKQALDGKEKAKIFGLGIELLKSDPWDVPTLRLLAQACAHFHYNEVELAYLKQAIDANPKDVDTNRHCARSLARMGQFDQAIACWHRIETIRPGDKEAPQMIVQLSEEKRKYPGGRPPNKSRPTEALPPAATKDSTPEAIEINLSPRQKFDRAIEEDPKNVSNYLELAKLLTRTEHFHEAEILLLRGISVCGDEPALKIQLQQIRSIRAKQEFAAAEARRKAEIKRQRPRFQITWVEMILMVAAIGLVLQLFPPIAAATWKILDFRHWSIAGWLAANIALLAFLFVVHYGPQSKRSRR